MKLNIVRIFLALAAFTVLPSCTTVEKEPSQTTHTTTTEETSRVVSPASTSSTTVIRQ